MAELTFTLEQKFDVPPEDVFDAAVNVEEYHAWMPGLVRVEKLTDGGASVGAKWRETRTIYGREGTEEFEVTHFERGKRMDLYVDGSKGTTGRGEYRFAYELEPVEGGGTLMKVNGSIGGMGVVGRLLGRLLMGSFKKAVERDHEALKAYVEKELTR